MREGIGKDTECRKALPVFKGRSEAVPDKERAAHRTGQAIGLEPRKIHDARGESPNERAACGR